MPAWETGGNSSGPLQRPVPPTYTVLQRVLQDVDYSDAQSPTYPDACHYLDPGPRHFRILLSRYSAHLFKAPRLRFPRLGRPLGQQHRLPRHGCPAEIGPSVWSAAFRLGGMCDARADSVGRSDRCTADMQFVQGRRRQLYSLTHSKIKKIVKSRCDRELAVQPFSSLQVVATHCDPNATKLRP